MKHDRSSTPRPAEAGPLAQPGEGRPRAWGVGDVLAGAYRLEAALGAGGMGSVFRARELATGRALAVKLPTRLTSQRLLARFEREARAAARIEHPHVVRVHSFGAERGVPYLVCELIEGARPLSELLPELPLSRRLDLLEQMAAGAAAAHAEGVVHRDLKPANVLVSPGRGALLADFGIARDVEALSRLTQTGEVVGTPTHMAPEQAQGAREVAPSVDVWALGVCLYEVLYDRLPFQGSSLAELLVQISSVEPELPSRSEAPPALVQLCRSALAKDPRRRPPDGASFARALRDARALRPRARAPLPFVAAGLLGVAGIAGALAWPQPREPSPPPAAPRGASSLAASPASTPALEPRLRRWAGLRVEQARLRAPGEVLLRVGEGVLLCSSAGTRIAELPALTISKTFHPRGVVEGPRGLTFVDPEGQTREHASAPPLRERLACDALPPRVIAWTRDRELHVQVEARPPRVIAFARRLDTLALSPAHLVVGSDRTTQVLSLPELELVGRHSVASRLLRISPTGTQVALGGRDGLAGVIDLAGGPPLLFRREHEETEGLAGVVSVSAHLGSIRGLAWSADGRLIYTAGSSARFREGVAVWDARTGALRAYGLRTLGGYYTLDVLGDQLLLVSDAHVLYTGSVQAVERYERLEDALR